MKISKQLSLAIVFLSSAIASFAGDNDSSEFSFNSSRLHIEKYAASHVDIGNSGASDLKRREFGIRYMPTFSSVDFNTYDNGVVKGEVVLSHGFGIMAAFNITRNLGIQAEINYYQSTQQYKDRNFTNDVTINYLNIPVLLSLNTNKEAAVNLNIVAGPQFGLNVGSKFESSGSNGADTVKAVVGLRKGDIGFAYGAGLEFALNSNHTVRLDLGYRGFFGLVNMDSSTNEDGTYNVIVTASRKTYGGYAGLTWLF